MIEIPSSAGNYVIIAELRRDLQLNLSSLGQVSIPAGTCCYCGGAHGPGGLKARVSRHLDQNACKFWHFDYLKSHVEIREVWWQAEKENRECEILQAILKIPGAQIPVKGFGSSDCRKGCPAHLAVFPAGVEFSFVMVSLRQNWPSFQRRDAQDDINRLKSFR